MTPRLSIIIVNWNSKAYVRKCLLSLDRFARSAHQTIVVDGASFDGCGEMISREFPSVEFVQSPENVGFGRCNNLGAGKANGEYLLFLNPDTELTAGALEALLKVAEGDSDVGLVGARLLNTDGSLQTSCVQALPTPLNQALDSDFLRRLLPGSRFWGNAAAFASPTPIQVAAVSGACMLIHRETFVSVGGFCPDYFMYAEDMHLCWEVSKLGKTVVYQPAAEIVHHGGGASAGDFSSFSCLEMRSALHHFIRCRQGVCAGFAYRMLIAVSALVRLTALSAAFSLQTGDHRSRIRVSLSRWWTNLCWALRPSGQRFKHSAKPQCSIA
jgi:GT2 family glycosyltransferase